MNIGPLVDARKKTSRRTIPNRPMPRLYAHFLPMRFEICRPDGNEHERHDEEGHAGRTSTDSSSWKMY